MSIDWIRVNIGLRRHPKYLLLRAAIGPQALECLIDLWSWAALARRNGVLADAIEAEIAAGWTGTRGELHAALVRVGFLEADGVTLHDWVFHNGGQIEAMIRSRTLTAARMRRQRASSPPVPPSSTTPTATPTATPTGDASHDTSRNASRYALRDALHPDDDGSRSLELAVRGQIPKDADSRLTLAFREYQASAGTDGYAAFCRQVRACEAQSVSLTAVMQWLHDHPGSHVHDARDALVAPPARPPRPGSGQDFSGI